MTPRIALMADSTESLESLFLPKKERALLFPLTLHASGIEPWVKKNFAPDHVIPITLQKEGAHLFSFEKLPWNSNVLHKMSSADITHLLAPYPCSKKFLNWVKKNNVILLTTPASLQGKFENKHHFDKLLKQYRIASPKTFTSREFKKKECDHRRLVVQRQRKDGSYITVIASGKNIKSKKSIKDNPSVLIREYIDGLPLGISIFVDQQGNFFYSALRRQCFASRNGFPNFNTFIGIQWMPTSSFSYHSLRAISQTLKKLTQLLMRSHYVGVANIDFILFNEKAYIIECNPRFSSATPQVFGVKQITSSSNPWRFFLNSLLGIQNRKLAASSLPQSNFSGATLDLEMNSKGKRVFPKPGVYTSHENRIAFVSDDIDALLPRPDAFALIHEAPYPGSAKTITIPCSIISNAPLYDFRTGDLNERGMAITRFVHALI